MQDAASVLARQRPDVHQPAGLPHHVHLVFHHEHRVPCLPEPAEHPEQGLRVRGVEACLLYTSLQFPR